MAFNIDRNPTLFVKYIALLGGRDLGNVGFDQTIRYVDKERYITIPGGAQDRFRIIGKAVECSRIAQIRGRCRKCWEAIDVTSGQIVFIKDAWRFTSWLAEEAYLKAARGLDGVNQLVASYDFSLEGRTTTFFRGQLNLHVSHPEFLRSKDNWTISRVVLVKEGKPVFYFNNRIHLLKIFKDAVIGQWIISFEKKWLLTSR